MKEVCIIGLGPAGFGALNRLIQFDVASETVCIEAGVSLPEKKCHLAEGKPCANEYPCEIISGVGGCSCITGAKLSGYPAGRGLGQIIGSNEKAKKRLSESLSTLRSLLPLPEEVKDDQSSETKRLYKKMGFAYKQYPVYTFNHVDLATAYKRILNNAESRGTSVLLKTEVIDITRVGEHYKLILSQGTKQLEFEANYLVLAVGSAGQEILEKVNSNFTLSKKQYHLDMGVRLEFPSTLFQDIDKHHGDLKLFFKDARTFCVCKGGKITPYRNHNIFALEGSLQKGFDTGFTNFAIIVRQKTYSKNLQAFNEILANVQNENNGIPVSQTLPEYLNRLDFKGNPRTPSTFGMWKPGKIDSCFPANIAKELREAIQFFASKLLPEDIWSQVNVFAPELDFRHMFSLQKDFSIAPKLYMAGDCTGRFRGILQAFCSGDICASNILFNLKEARNS